MEPRKRMLISFCVTTGLMASAPLTAQASVGAAGTMTCAQMLLKAPARDLQWELHITPEQASHLWAIRHRSSRRQAAIQRELDRVRARSERLSHVYAPRRVRHLRRQEASLMRRLQQERVQAARRIVTVLTPWQRSRCAPWMIYRSTRPRPVWSRSPRRVSHARPRVVHRAPRVVHRAPRVGHRAPRVVHTNRHRAPSTVVHHHRAPRDGYKKHVSKAPQKGKRKHR
jgi:Spy/CpxP family protein refolding chaperone